MAQAPGTPGLRGRGQANAGLQAFGDDGRSSAELAMGENRQGSHSAERERSPRTATPAPSTILQSFQMHDTDKEFASSYEAMIKILREQGIEYVKAFTRLKPDDTIILF